MEEEVGPFQAFGIAMDNFFRELTEAFRHFAQSMEGVTDGEFYELTEPIALPAGPIPLALPAGPIPVESPTWHTPYVQTWKDGEWLQLQSSAYGSPTKP